MPVNDYMKVDTSITTAIFARELVTLVAQLRSTINQLDKVKALMDHNSDGTTWTTVETLFGLAAGKGQPVYDLVNGTRGALGGTFQNSNAISLIDRVGG